MIIAQRIRIVVGLAALALSFSSNGVSGATGSTTDDTATEEDPCSPATSTEASSPEASAPPSSADDGATAAGEFLPDIEVVRVALGEKTFAKAFAAGQGMTPEQALTVARSG